MSNNKKEFVIFLQNLLKVLNVELMVVDKEIEVQMGRIDSIIQRMKRIAQDIAVIEDKRKNMELVLGDLKTSVAREKSIIDSLLREMDDLRREAERIQFQIRMRQAEIDSFGIFKFLAEGIMALVESLTGDLRAAEGRIRQYEERWNDMRKYLEDSDKKEREYEERIQFILNEKKKLDVEQEKNDDQIKQLGKQKTTQENFKLNLQHFKTRAVSLLDTVNINVEFPDDMLNTKEDLMNQIKETYLNNNRPLPKDLFPECYGPIKAVPYSGPISSSSSSIYPSSVLSVPYSAINPSTPSLSFYKLSKY